MATSRSARLIVATLATLILALPLFAPHPADAAGTADLSVTMKGDHKVLKFGDTMTFTVTATNLGPDEATGVNFGIGVSDSYANFGGTCPDGLISNMCNVGTMASGASVSVLFRVMALCCNCCPDNLGVAVASVSHDADTVDPVSANDQVRIETKFVGKAPS
jgi:hypothetical protein